MIPLLLSVALASPCEQLPDGLPDGTLTPWLVDGGLGRAHPVCARDELGVGAQAYLVADTANFYGHIQLAGVIDGRWAATDRVEVFGAVEAVRYDQVIGALTSDALGIGHTTVGASVAAWSNEEHALAVNAKAVLPTAVGLYENAWPIGADLGLGWVWARSERLRVHGQVTALGSGAITAASAQPRVGATVNAGAEWRFVKPLALVGEVDAGFAYTAPVDHLAVGVGLRAKVGKRGGLELGGVVPLAGRERALASAGLRGSWRLGKLPDEPVPVPLGLPVSPK